MDHYIIDNGLYKGTQQVFPRYLIDKLSKKWTNSVHSYYTKVAEPSINVSLHVTCCHCQAWKHFKTSTIIVFQMFRCAGSWVTLSAFPPAEFVQSDLLKSTFSTLVSLISLVIRVSLTFAAENELVFRGRRNLKLNWTSFNKRKRKTLCQTIKPGRKICLIEILESWLITLLLIILHLDYFNYSEVCAFIDEYTDTDMLRTFCSGLFVSYARH